MGCGTSAQIADTINQTPYVISLLGLPNVGKTSLLELYCDEYSKTNPPIHTNGIIIRELNIRSIRYRFIDLSGYFSHFSEWEESIKQSDAAIFVCDKPGIEDGICFTNEMLEKIRPLIYPSQTKTFSNKNQSEAENSPKLNSGSRSKSRPTIPVFILVTKASPNQDLTLIKQSAKKILPTSQMEFGYITEFNSDAFQVFDWFEQFVFNSKKK